MGKFTREYVSRHERFAKDLRQQHVYGDPIIIKGQIGADVVESSTGKKASCFTCLDYLGFGKYWPVQKHMAECIMELGTATIGSRVIMDSDVIRSFERDLARFKGSEDCMLLSSGYSASSCLVSMLANEANVAGHRLRNRKKTYIFVDRLAHASIQEGLLQFRHKKNGKVQVSVHAHLDYDGLEEELSKIQGEDADRFIIADSLFSMTGSRPDCKRLAMIARKYDAIVALDGAHCDGVFGTEGRGILFEDGISESDREFFFEAGTVSKSMASMGGFVTIPHHLADVGRVSQWRNIFSTALPTALVKADAFTLSLIRGPEGEKRRRKVMTLGENLLNTFQAKGFDTMNSSSYIIPVVIGDEGKCLEVQRSIFNESDAIVGAIRYPAVERGRAILRIAVTAEHEEGHLEKIVSAMEKARDRFNF